MAQRAETAAGTLVSLRFGSRTDVGRKRAVNEDSILAASPVFIVADGMGGHEAGDLASAAVVAEFRSLIGRPGVRAEEVAWSVDRANDAVRRVAEGTTKGAGSTLAGVVLVDHLGRPHWLVLNVGDSRVYRMLDGDLNQLTVDHSVAQELVDNGTLQRSDVATFAQRNVITRAMGADDSPADYWLIPVITGERILVCSDGLTGELNDETIKAGLTLNGETQQTADILLGQALARGGRDNISVLVIDVVAGGATVREDPSTSSSGDTAAGSVDDTVDVRRDETAEVPGRKGRRNVH